MRRRSRCAGVLLRVRRCDWPPPRAGGAVAQQPVAPGAALLEPLPMPEILKQYQPIPAERLKNPADGDWPMFRRTYDGWGYSPLSQINTDNVQRLQPAWVFSTGVENGHEAPPIVVNGVMFVATPGNQVLAIDAKTGTLLWRYRRPLPTPGRAAASDEPRRRRLRRQGVLRRRRSRARRARCKDRRGSWTTTRGRQRERVLHVARAARRRRESDDRHVGRRARHPRLCLGVRRRDRQGAVEDLHGAGARRAGQRNLAEGRRMENGRRFGVGDGELRSGDEPLVLGHRERRPVDGRSAARRQPVHRLDGCHRCRHRPDQGPHAVQPERIVGLGRSVAADSRSTSSAAAARSKVWSTSRATASCISSSVRPARSISSTAMPFVRQNVFRGFDPKTGRPDVDPDKKPGTDKMADFCPSWWGGKNWPPAAFNPKTRMLYIPANENLCSTMIGREVTYVKGRSYTGATTTLYAYPGAKHFGEVQAGTSTPASACGRTRSRSRRTGGRSSRPAAASCSRAAPTIGCSAHSTRRTANCSGKRRPTRASSAFRCRSRSTAGSTSPCSRASASTRAAMQARLNRLFPGEYPEVPEGGAVWVFALRGK